MELNHITLHNITRFNEVRTNEKVVNRVTINGHNDEESVTLTNLNSTISIQTAFLQNEQENNFEKYRMNFQKKTRRIRPIRFRNEITNDYLDIYDFYAYKVDDVFITAFDFSKQINQSAINKLSSKSAKVKFTEYNIDLLEFIENIVNSTVDIEITSTWFNNLNLRNLNAVKLEGEEVNLGPDWTNYKQNATSKATSLGLCINEVPFNNLKLSLSHDGSIYISPGVLEEEDLLKLAKLIMKVIEFNL